MRALVLGSEGFIGGHLVSELRGTGHAVWGIDASDCDLSCQWPSAVPHSLDVVFLLAARLGVSAVEAAPYDTLDTNVRIVQNVLRWLPNKGERLVFASSSEVYAAAVSKGLAPIPTPESVPLVADPESGRGAYALSKVLGEALVRHRHNNWTAIRYHNVYGPGQTRGVIYDLWQRRSDSPFSLPGAGHTRSFCFIEDAIEATLRLAQLEAARNQVVNVGNPEEVTIQDLATRLIGRRRYFPKPSSGPKRRVPDITRLQLLTGWKPRIMLDEGLERTKAWLSLNAS